MAFHIEHQCIPGPDAIGSGLVDSNCLAFAKPC